MNNLQPLLSIIVPTKDRYKYLKHLIRYVVDLNNADIELIIQDNTSENSEIINFLSDSSCENIKYFHTKHSIPIGDNSDKAVLNSTGEYVCYIGDDDAFLPDIVEYVRRMKEKNVEAGIFPRPRYIWPDINEHNSAYKQSCYIDKVTKHEHEIFPKDEIIALLENASISMLNLPHLYHGIVLRETLDKIYEKCGTYFPGPSPDMANAIALSYVAKKVYYYDYPLIIAGTGYTRIKGNERGDYKELENLPFLPKDTIDNWHPLIPKVWTIPTIFAQTSYIALAQFDKDIFKHFNWIKFYSIMGFQFPDDTKYYISKLKINDIIKIRCNIAKQRLRSAIGRFVRPILNQRIKIKIGGENNTAIEFAYNIYNSLI